jgi:hypothetical protein
MPKTIRKHGGTAMLDRCKLFNLGRVTRTVGAYEALCEAQVSEAALLARHQGGDWGDLDAPDHERNQLALRHGGRILSAYRIGPDRSVWVSTDADRRTTVLLMPCEHERRLATAYELRFRSLFDPGRGLAFPCDESGRVDIDILSERARHNYLYARALAGRDYAVPAVLARVDA